MNSTLYTMNSILYTSVSTHVIAGLDALADLWMCL